MFKTEDSFDWKLFNRSNMDYCMVDVTLKVVKKLIYSFLQLLTSVYGVDGAPVEGGMVSSW